MNNETIEKAKTKMTDSIKVYQKRLASIRAGVANAALLDNVQVEYYGAPTPLDSNCLVLPFLNHVYCLLLHMIKIH